ncbi:MAG: hypothetical protein RL141_470 [Candidatus Parcubacteria bacterium]|jgi:hypothetical protein
MSIHPHMAAGRWQEYPFAVQMANVGGEVHRARMAQERCAPEERVRHALERALELLDLTRLSPPSAASRRELGRLREAIASQYVGVTWCHTDLAWLDRYFHQFALLAAARR